MDARPAFIEMTGVFFTKNLFNDSLPSYTVCVAYYRNNSCDWFTLLADQTHIGQTVVREFMTRQTNFLRLYKRWLKNYAVMMHRYDLLFKQDLSLLSNADLLDWNENLEVLYRQIEMPGFIDGFMFYAEKRLTDLLTQFCEPRGLNLVPYLFSTLTAPIEPSFINNAEQGVNEIAKLLLKNGFSDLEPLPSFMDKLPPNDLAVKKIKNHLRKYSWIKTSYAGYKEYSLKDLETEIKHHINNDSQKVKAGFAAIKKIKKNLIAQYKFSPEIITISKLTEIVVAWQDHRKEYSLTFDSLKDKFFKEMEKRVKIPETLVAYGKKEEFKASFNNSTIAKVWQEREKGSLYVYSKSKIQAIYTGSQIMEFLKNAYPEIKENITEIKGTPACLGVVKGKVRIVLTASENSKLLPGEVLVTSMTRPEHLPAMKRAAAIITDDGGVTCHAAIVSRELNKPCIIGTRIATKVLRDGEMVEVNANEGIVRRIK